MKKILFCNTDLLVRVFDEMPEEITKENRKRFLELAETLCIDDKDSIVFISKENKKLNRAREVMENKGYKKFKYVTRSAAKEYISAHMDKATYFVFVGNREIDFQTAVNIQVLFICPTWVPVEEKAERYGVNVDTPEQFYKFIKTLNNHDTWYSQAKIDQYSQCISLMDARTYAGSPGVGEKQMLIGFQNLLKNGTNRNYYRILLYHFLANMTRTSLFDDIELFGIMPSSNCNVNPDMFKFMEQVRYIKKKQLPRQLYHKEPIEQNLFLRHTVKPTMHSASQYGRAKLGGINEFKTLIINPEYKDKISRLKKSNNLNILVFDDYMNYGNGFNAVRCLLESVGANKIVFVSLGSFRQEFYFKDYQIQGDVFSPNGYTVKLVNQKIITDFEIYPQAKEEIDNLYDIFNT